MRAMAAVSLIQTHRPELDAKRKQPTTPCCCRGERFGPAAGPGRWAARMRSSESSARRSTQWSLACPGARCAGGAALAGKWQQRHPTGAGARFHPRLSQPSTRFPPSRPSVCPSQTAGDKPVPCLGHLPPFSRLSQNFAQFPHRAASRCGFNCTGMFSECAF